MTTIAHGGPPAAAMRARDGVRLPERELAAARAEPKQSCHARIAAPALRAA